MRTFLSLSALSLLALTAGVARTAQADPVPYPNSGTVAPTTHLTGSGADVTAYFAGSTASYSEQVGMYVNGVLSPAGFIFPNHDTADGTALDLGFAPAGSSLIFAIQVYSVSAAGSVVTTGTGNPHYANTPDYLLYSVPSDPATGFANSDGVNHAYITSFTTADTSAVLPVTGTYVAFEDELVPGSDLNYHDENFVFTNVVAGSVPEPGSVALLFGIGAVGTGLLTRRRR